MVKLSDRAAVVFDALNTSFCMATFGQATFKDIIGFRIAEDINQ